MKKILVIGGSQGIGYQTVKRFLDAGDAVVYTYHRHKEDAEALASLYPGQAKPCYLDLRSEASVEALYEACMAFDFVPDTLVYAAGLDHSSLLQETSIDTWDKLFAVNIRGLFLLTRLFLPHMIAQQKGSILALSSIWGANAASCEVVYAATKGAMEAFIRSLAAEVAPSQVRVLGLAPGPVQTAMWDVYTPEDQEAILSTMPLCQEAMQASDIAEWIYFLSTPAAKHLTGQIITVDGGFTL